MPGSRVHEGDGAAGEVELVLLMELLESMLKLSTKKPSQDFDGQKEARPCPDPAVASGIEPTTGDDAV